MRVGERTAVRCQKKTSLELHTVIRTVHSSRTGSCLELGTVFDRSRASLKRNNNNNNRREFKCKHVLKT